MLDWTLWLLIWVFWISCMIGLSWIEFFGLIWTESKSMLVDFSSLDFYMVDLSWIEFLVCNLGLEWTKWWLIKLCGFFKWLIWAELSSSWLIWAELNSMVADLKQIDFFWLTWLNWAELKFLWLIWVQLSSLVHDLSSLDLLHGWFGVNSTLCG